MRGGFSSEKSADNRLLDFLRRALFDGAGVALGDRAELCLTIGLRGADQSDLPRENSVEEGAYCTTGNRTFYRVSGGLSGEQRACCRACR